MASNLLTQLMNDFRGDALNGVASALGESSARTQSALDGVLPALIGGLALKAATTDQAGHLLDVIKRSKLDTDTFTDASSALKAPGGFNTSPTWAVPSWTRSSADAPRPSLIGSRRTPASAVRLLPRSSTWPCPLFSERLRSM